jgi:hypothetical protein
MTELECVRNSAAVICKDAQLRSHPTALDPKQGEGQMANVVMAMGSD